MFYCSHKIFHQKDLSCVNSLKFLNLGEMPLKCRADGHLSIGRMSQKLSSGGSFNSGRCLHKA